MYFGIALSSRTVLISGSSYLFPTVNISFLPSSIGAGPVGTGSNALGSAGNSGASILLKESEGVI